MTTTWPRARPPACAGGGWSDAGATGAPTEAPSNGTPQNLQKRDAASFAPPQRGQLTGIAPRSGMAALRGDIDGPAPPWPRAWAALASGGAAPDRGSAARAAIRSDPQVRQNCMVLAFSVPQRWQRAVATGCASGMGAGD